MQKLLILCLCCLAFNINLSSQNDKPTLSVQEVVFEDNRSVSKDFKAKLESRLKNKFLITTRGLLQLSASISLGKMHTLNGMDTYTTTDAVIEYNIEGSTLPSEKISLSLKCKGKNEKDLVKKIGLTMARDRKHNESLNEFIHSYLKKHITSCSDVSKIIKNKLSKKDISSAVSVLGYYDWLGNCEEEKGKSDKAIMDKHSQYACDVTIQKSTILANSSNKADLNRAIDLLQMIPPDAPCAKEAIKVSELVSKNAKELNAVLSKQIHDKITIVNSVSESDWRVWYNKNYQRIYN